MERRRGDDGDDLLQFPVPAECQNGVSGPETEFRDVAAFWRVPGDFDFLPRVFRSKPLSSPEEGVRGQPRGPHARAARPPPGCAGLAFGGPGPPPGLPFWLRDSSGKIGPLV